MSSIIPRVVARNLYQFLSSSFDLFGFNLVGTAEQTYTFPAASATIPTNSQNMYIGTTAHAINRASAAEILSGITGLTPGANFTLTQNAVAVLTSEETSATVNTLYLKGGKVGIGNNNPTYPLDITGTARATLFFKDAYGVVLKSIAGNGYGRIYTAFQGSSYNADMMSVSVGFTRTSISTGSGDSSGKPAEILLLGTDAYAGGEIVFGAAASGGYPTERMRITSSGRVGIGLTLPTALLHLKAGTAVANTAPLKFTSGALLTAPEAGAVEFLTDAFYGTITTGTTRRMLVGSQTGRSAAQTAAIASVATHTLGAADASFEVSANVLVTTSSAEAFTVTCAYTDEGNTARTLTLPFVILAGTTVAAINSANGAVPYEGVPVHIRCKASTAITIATTGTFTGATYNVEGIIKRIA